MQRPRSASESSSGAAPTWSGAPLFSPPLPLLSLSEFLCCSFSLPFAGQCKIGWHEPDAFFPLRVSAARQAVAPETPRPRIGHDMATGEGDGSSLPFPILLATGPRCNEASANPRRELTCPRGKGRGRGGRREREGGGHLPLCQAGKCMGSLSLYMTRDPMCHRLPSRSVLPTFHLY